MAEVGGSYQASLTRQQEDELRSIAAKIMAPGKGILAADESTGKLGEGLEARRRLIVAFLKLNKLKMWQKTMVIKNEL